MPKATQEFRIDKRELKGMMIAFCQKYDIARFEVDLEFTDSSDSDSDILDLNRMVRVIKFDITI